MNKQSNIYTLIYIVVLVVVVGTALAFTAISLKDRQQANADADKMRQILASVGLTVSDSETAATYRKYIVETLVVDEYGRVVEGADAFSIDVAKQSKEAASNRLLPVYICQLDQNDRKYILPMYGAGLWGPIWGYISVDADGSTIFGAYFAHQGETPGLGAEIAKPAFCDQFAGKQLMKNGNFLPVTVVKAGQTPKGDEDYVDGVSGGTITSKGVAAMIDNCILPYKKFLNQIAENNEPSQL